VNDQQRVAGNMYAQLELEFSQDTLYKKALKGDPNQFGNIIDDFIESLDEFKEYSTSEFAAVYCDSEKEESYLCNESTMRRWLSSMNQYIEAQVAGKRNWKLNYQSMFRLRMVLMFKKNGFKQSTIQTLVGIRPTIELMDDDYEQPAKNEISSATAVSQHIPENTNMLLRLLLKQLEEIGIIQIDPIEGIKKGQLALPGDTEERFKEIFAKQDEQAELIKNLQEENQDQKLLLEAQNNLMNMLSDIYDISSKEDIEEQRDLVSRIRSEDLVISINAKMEYINLQKQLKLEAEKNKKSSGFFRRLFGG
jgi:hypothetical protein